MEGGEEKQGRPPNDVTDKPSPQACGDEEVASPSQGCDEETSGSESTFEVWKRKKPQVSSRKIKDTKKKDRKDRRLKSKAEEKRERKSAETPSLPAIPEEMSTQEKACVPPEQSAAVPCTSTSTSQESGVSPEQSAAIPCASGGTSSKTGVSSEQSAAIPSSSSSAESSGSVPLVTATSRTLAPLTTSTNPDELIKDLLFLSTITSGLSPNKRKEASEQRLMEFHRLAVKEKNFRAIITIRNHKFIEFLDLDAFIRKHLLRPGEAPLPPKSPRRRHPPRTSAPSAATSDAGPIKYRDYRIAEGLVAAPAASNTSSSSTPVIASGSASSEVVRVIPSSPASTSSFPRMSTPMFAVPSAEVPRLLQNLEASAGAPSLSDDAMETESAATPTPSEIDRLLQVSVVKSPIKYPPTPSDAGSKDVEMAEVPDTIKEVPLTPHQSAAESSSTTSETSASRTSSLKARSTAQDPRRFRFDPWNPGYKVSRASRQRRNRKMVRLLELEQEMAKVKSALSKQTEAAERRRTLTDLRKKLTNPKSERELKPETKSSAHVKEGGSQKHMSSVIHKRDASKPQPRHREDSSRRSSERTYQSGRQSSEASQAHGSRRTSSSCSRESTDYLPGRVFYGRGHYALDFQRSSKGSAMETPGRGSYSEKAASPAPHRARESSRLTKSSLGSHSRHAREVQDSPRPSTSRASPPHERHPSRSEHDRSRLSTSRTSPPRERHPSRADPDRSRHSSSRSSPPRERRSSRSVSHQESRTTKTNAKRKHEESFSRGASREESHRSASSVPRSEPSGSGSAKQNDQEECTLCRTWHSDLRLHVENSHLPWYFNPFRVNWKQETRESRSASSIQHQRRISETHHQKWGSLVLGALYFVAARLERTSLSDLFLYVSQRRLYPTRMLGGFTPEECRLLHYIESDLLTTTSGPVPVYEGSPPTSISSLLHWRTMLSLLHLLSNEEREEFRDYACPMNRDGLPLSTPRATDHSLEFIDTHMHLDLSLQNLRLSSFKQLEERTKSGTLNIIKVIANYVFPSSWNDAQIHTDNDKQNRVAVTFGIHPHAAPKHLNKIDELRRLLDHPRCVGLGEIGMDFSRSCQCDRGLTNLCHRHRSQENMLRRMLPLAASTDKTLVIHSRGRTPTDGSAAAIVLDLLESLKLTNLRVHRHCFVGSATELEQWMRVLPSAMFGITAKALNTEAQQTVVAKIPLDRLLLESDAPFLPPSRAVTTFNTSWLCQHTATEVARIKGVTVIDLLQHCNNNARRLYRL